MTYNDIAFVIARLNLHTKQIEQMFSSEIFDYINSLQISPNLPKYQCYVVLGKDGEYHNIFGDKDFSHKIFEFPYYNLAINKKLARLEK